MEKQYANTHAHTGVHTQQTLSKKVCHLCVSTLTRCWRLSKCMAKLQKGGKWSLRGLPGERPSPLPFLPCTCLLKHLSHPFLTQTVLWLFFSSTQVLIFIRFSKTTLFLRLPPFQQIGLKLGGGFNGSWRQKVLLNFISCFSKKRLKLIMPFPPGGSHQAQMMPAWICTGGSSPWCDSCWCEPCLIFFFSPRPWILPTLHPLPLSFFYCSIFPSPTCPWPQLPLSASIYHSLITPFLSFLVQEPIFLHCACTAPSSAESQSSPIHKLTLLQSM